MLVNLFQTAPTQAKTIRPKTGIDNEVLKLEAAQNTWGVFDGRVKAEYGSWRPGDADASDESEPYSGPRLGPYRRSLRLALKRPTPY